MDKCWDDIDIVRFLNHRIVLDSGCWGWRLASNGFSLRKSGPHWSNYKFAYYAFNCQPPYEEIPKGMVIRHLCGNHWCVNPKHLKVGTPKENSDDKYLHGTMPFGERNGMKKYPQFHPDNANRNWTGEINDLDRQRMLRRVVKDEVTGCWNYQSGNRADDPTRHPGFWLRGIEGQANRASYRMFKGDIPDGMLVRHTCDNPKCVNPDHLILGTPADNARDRSSRGRGGVGVKNGSVVHKENRPRGSWHKSKTRPESVPRGDAWHARKRTILKGENHGMAKLSDDQVLQIREFGKTLAARNLAKQLSAIANRYQVSAAMVGLILSGKNWKHVIGENAIDYIAKIKQQRGGRRGNAKLTFDQVREIKTLLRNSTITRPTFRHRDIACKFEVSPCLVSHIEKGILYKEIV